MNFINVEFGKSEDFRWVKANVILHSINSSTTSSPLSSLSHPPEPSTSHFHDGYVSYYMKSTSISSSQSPAMSQMNSVDSRKLGGVVFADEADEVDMDEQTRLHILFRAKQSSNRPQWRT